MNPLNPTNSPSSIKKMDELDQNQTSFNPDLFWNKFKFKIRDRGYWKFGPLELWLERFVNEWRIWWHYDENFLSNCCKSRLTDQGPMPSLPNLHHKRFAFTQTEDFISLVPTLPDRAIVARPDPSFHILPNEEISLFLSIPLWIRIETESKKIIDEIPVYPLSETWFGNLTGDGEFCYSTKTTAMLCLKELPPQYHQAITAVYIKNLGKNNLHLEKVKLPIPNLSLFQNHQGFFYTQSITLEGEKDGTLVHLKFNPRPHPEAGDTWELYAPRVPLRENIIIKTLNHFL